MGSSGSHIEFAILHEDIADTAVEIIVLKYAQRFHGADRHIANILTNNVHLDLSRMELGASDEAFFDTNGAVASRHVLFLGAPAIDQFRYKHVFDIGRRLVTSLNIAAKNLKHIATTIHGVESGLDEAASSLAQVAGIVRTLEILRSSNIESIAFVERDAARAQRLRILFEQLFHGDDRMQRNQTGSDYAFHPWQRLCVNASLRTS